MSGPTMREMIDRLIAEPSVSSTDPERDMGNEGVVDRLATWLEDEGWAVEKLEVSPGKHNLVATLGRGSGGLVLSGHTDTVPFDEPLWSSDPFTATERDGNLYGLGTCDMKAFLALAIEASRRFDPKDLKRPIVLLGTADEETGMDGARALVRAGKPEGRYAVIGEPTGMAPVRMHKGCSVTRLELHGQSGHSSNPDFGVNALDGMHAAIRAIMEVRDGLAVEAHNDRLTPPHATINLGRIEGGDNANRICGRCALDYDLRVLPGGDAKEVRARIEQAVRAVIDPRLELTHSPLCDDAPPFETDPTSELVKVAEALTGHESGAVSFGTEAPFLTALGMDTLVLGPGDIDVAHQPDEHLPLDRVPRMLDLLEGFIGRLCVEAG